MAEANSSEESAGEPIKRADAARPQRSAAGGPSLIALYKPGQGTIVRWSTAVGGGLVGLWAAQFLYDQLQGWGITTRSLVPLAFLVAVGLVIFRLVGQSRGVVDFLIATEGEMHKVNWSSWREVRGATQVVIFTVLVLAFLLFIVDILFIFLFESIGILRLGILDQMFKIGDG